MKKSLTILVFALTLLINLNAQVNTQQLIIGSKYQVLLANETSFIGIFDGFSQDSTLFFSQEGLKFEVQTQQLKSLKVLENSQIKNGKYWYPNPHATRYFFGPTAFNLKEEEGYFQSIYGLVNSVNYGFTDHFTLGLGTEIITLFNGPQTAILTPKFGGYKITDKTYGGFGSLMIINKEVGISGIAYGIVSRGNLDHNFTVGTGWAFSTESFIQNKPILTFSGMTRVSKNIAFVSENWLIPVDQYEIIFSYGL
ncbi:MAG TPA: hypothetical protein PKD85_05235, partial [Saprospiraceae bacterium]|nr:hypothetical protein [Saprospiraceae bacterium]